MGCSCAQRRMVVVAMGATKCSREGTLGLQRGAWIGRLGAASVQARSFGAVHYCLVQRVVNLLSTL